MLVMQINLIVNREIVSPSQEYRMNSPPQPNDRGSHSGALGPKRELPVGAAPL